MTTCPKPGLSPEELSGEVESKLGVLSMDSTAIDTYLQQ